MGNWRPKGWKNEFKGQPGGAIITSNHEVAKVYEAGADAMLNGLLEQPNTFYTDSLQLKEFCEKNRGWLVFLPDDKE